VGEFLVDRAILFQARGHADRRRQDCEAAAQIAALRKEIDKLQADQGARLAAQQDQLEILQQKLDSETKTANQLAAKATDEAPPTAPNRVIAVEPASDANPEPDVAAANTKLATAETSAEPGKVPEVVPPFSPPLPEGVTRAELAEDIVSELKDLDCYRSPVNGSWGRSAQNALELQLSCQTRPAGRRS
jgi:hypothetical protein